MQVLNIVHLGKGEAVDKHCSRGGGGGGAVFVHYALGEGSRGWGGDAPLGKGAGGFFEHCAIWE